MTSERMLVTLTCCDLSVRKFINQQINPISVLLLFRHWASMWGWIQLKAEEQTDKAFGALYMGQGHMKKGHH